MKTYEYNGEQWYMNVQPLWRRLLRWLVWFGGWEHVVHDEAGYRYEWRPRHAVGLALRARGSRSRPWAIYTSMCPLGFFGGKLTLNSFGFHLSTRRGYWCVTWPNGWPHKAVRGRPWKVYWSRDATPWGATLWLVGAPKDVQRGAAQTAEQAVERQRERAS